jgi:hypothetical protein
LAPERQAVLLKRDQRFFAILCSHAERAVLQNLVAIGGMADIEQAAPIAFD